MLPPTSTNKPPTTTHFHLQLPINTNKIPTTHYHQEKSTATHNNSLIQTAIWKNLASSHYHPLSPENPTTNHYHQKTPQQPPTTIKKKKKIPQRPTSSKSNSTMIHNHSLLPANYSQQPIINQKSHTATHYHSLLLNKNLIKMDCR